MKKILALLAFATGLALAQAPDCSQTFTFSTSGIGLAAPGVTSSFPNVTPACNYWVVTYQSTGFTGITLTFESSFGVFAPTTWAAFSGTITTGVNPNTNLVQNMTIANGYVGWYRMNLSAIVGTGTVTGTIKGWAKTVGGGTFSSPANGLFGTFSIPLDGGFTWINQDNATTTTLTPSGYVRMFVPCTAAVPPAPAGICGGAADTANLHMRCEGLPNAPFTLIAGFLPEPGITNSTFYYGLSIPNGAATATEILELQYVGGGLAQENFYGNCNMQGGVCTTVDNNASLMIDPIQWVRIVDDATNRSVQLSRNGVNWTGSGFLHRTSASFALGNQACWFINKNNGNYAVALTLPSFCIASNASGVCP